MAIYPSR